MQRWDGLGGLAGIACVAATVAGWASGSEYLYGLASGLFVWFLGSLRSFLRSVEGETGSLSAIAVVAGSVLPAVVLVAVARPEPALGRLAFFPAATFVAGAAAAMVVTGALSRALGWAGAGVAGILLVGAAGVARTACAAALLTWILATAALMAARAPARASGPGR